VLCQYRDVAVMVLIAIPSDTRGETPLGLIVIEKGATTTAEDIFAWANAKQG